jgi:hypothetical protein
MATAQVPVIDMNKLNAFIGQFVTDLGAAVHTGMVVIGEKLGLYKALANESMTPAQLAAKTQTDERYLREWLASQAAGGYVTYDAETGQFSLSKEQAFPHICPGHSNWLWARLRRFRESRNPSEQAPEWAGMNMPTVSFTAVRSSFVPAMRQIW